MTNPKGRFGVHGGQYIPETLMNAVIELEAAYDHYKNDEAFNRELTELLNEYAGQAIPAVFCQKDDGGSGRGEDLSEAGGSEPHRGPQDQQCAGTGPSGQADGQDPPDCRDGGGAARGGYRHRRRPHGDGVRGLYGGGRYRPPGPQCVPDASSGSGGGSCKDGHSHAEGRRIRGHAGVDLPHRPTPTTAWAL